MENEILQQILNKLTSMELDIKELKQGQSNLENELKSVSDCQKENTEFIKAIKHSTEYTNAKVDRMDLKLAKIEGGTESISKKISLLEIVTADNWGDIARLKSAK